MSVFLEGKRKVSDGDDGDTQYCDQTDVKRMPKMLQMRFSFKNFKLLTSHEFVKL